MIKNGLEIRAYKVLHTDIIDFVIRHYKNGKAAISRPLVFDNYKPGDVITPTFSLDYLMAQSLMDNLWECGLRPSEELDNTGKFEATQKHLEDMRKIVAKKLNIKL